MGAPCQAGWQCHPRRREKVGQQSGTVALSHFSASRLITRAHCNLGVMQFFLSSSLSKTATLGFLWIVLLLLISRHWIGIDLCIWLIFAAVNKKYVPLPFSFGVLFPSYYFQSCSRSWFWLWLKWWLEAKFVVLDWAYPYCANWNHVLGFVNEFPWLWLKSHLVCQMFDELPERIVFMFVIGV